MRLTSSSTALRTRSAIGISASLGALVQSGDSAYRVPTVRVRVGNYNFDNTNHMYSDAYVGSRYDPERLPLDDNYMAFRAGVLAGHGSRLSKPPRMRSRASDRR